jgi:cyclic di-GMP phosphodiesterase
MLIAARLAPETCTDPILVVDDDPSLREMIRVGLTYFGYPVRVAAGTAEARDLLRTEACSMVLCDYEMPGGSGLDLLAYVTRVYPHLPFVMLTGYHDTALACSTIAAGALDFLTKPLEFKHLARLIEQNRTRVERDRQRMAELTNELLIGTIRALVAAVDAKDPYTATHSERVTRLALRLGKALDLPPDRLKVLEFSALLHDVGKLGVPEAILSKPEPLDERERLLIRQHPARSADIVNQVGPLGEVASIVRHHHERMDGKGYPDRLRGEAIPLLARLVTLADVYEALTADRSYRRALKPAQAREIIRAGMGTHFDPQLGDVFLSLENLP